MLLLPGDAGPATAGSGRAVKFTIVPQLVAISPF